MNDALTALFALQQVDVALATAQRQHKALDPGRAEQAVFDEAHARHEQVSSAHSELTRDLHAAELEQKSVEIKKNDFEGKLYGGRVTAFKELEAMQQEIEALGRQRSRLDERILELLEQIELRRTEEAAARTALDSAQAALAKKQTAYKSNARALAKQIKTLTADRQRLAAPVPAPLLKRYDSLCAHYGGVGIGIIEDSRCGACHTNLPSQLLLSVQETDRVVTCENCGRLLCAVAE